MTDERCPTCGAPVGIVSGADGTNYYVLKAAPMLHLIFDGLKERGWRIEAGHFIDPEGNKYGSVESAIEAQTFREIAAS